MIENAMVIDSLWPNDDYTDHWDEDSTDELIEEYCGDRDIITEAVALWLDVENGDADRLQIVYDNLPTNYKRDILRQYIEYHDKQSDFDEWWEVKFNPGNPDDCIEYDGYWRD